MNKNGLVVLVLCASGASLAQESGLSVSAGARAWYAQWTTFSYVTDNAGNRALIQVSADDKLVLLPVVSLRYGNFVGSFQNPVAVLLYVVANVLLGLHLYHGVWSMMQTLGLSHPRYDHLRHALATLVAVVVVLGNISFPLAVLTGLLHE